ncbi:MAG: helix-turn-helix domain-containing protein [Endozoicomonadaceae bacterium]|nr:helix-turn-helix domain-containing protein [Endozoicomonadaceae bacterium]
MSKTNKTKTSLYRRLLIANLIDSGINSVPKIMNDTNMPRRTIQGTIKSLKEIDIKCEFVGANKDGYYKINDWGAINSKWIKVNLQHVKEVLELVDI